MMPFLGALFRRKSSGKMGKSSDTMTVTLSYKAHKPWRVEVEDDATVRLVKVRVKGGGKRERERTTNDRSRSFSLSPTRLS